MAMSSPGPRANPSPLRRLARRLYWLSHLSELRYRLDERRIARTAPAGAHGPDLPPPLMRVMVCGSADPEEFLEAGRVTVEAFDGLLAAQGRAFAQAEAVLDIGCGCGRLARWVGQKAGGPLSGVDINRPMVAWCRRHLAGDWRPVRLGGRLPFAAAAFDLAYACSVITHLREKTAEAWFDDLRRVMRPGGLLLVTFHDPHHPSIAQGKAGLRDQLAAAGYAVDIDRMEGSNRLAAYASIEHLATLAGPGFALVDHHRSMTTPVLQAIAIFRRV